jgi:hypothetical protein
MGGHGDDSRDARKELHPVSWLLTLGAYVRTGIAFFALGAVPAKHSV